jgi:hypothetical protein
MTMFDQVFLNWLFVAVGAMGGFILKATWDALVQLREDMSALQKSIAESYVRRDDFKDHAQRVVGLLDRIYEKLEHKADKQ